MSEDTLIIQEAVQRKAQGDASFLHLLQQQGKASLLDRSGDYLAAQAAARVGNRTQGTSLFVEWPQKYYRLYLSVFLATWDELEKGEAPHE